MLASTSTPANGAGEETNVVVVMFVLVSIPVEQRNIEKKHFLR